MSVTQTQNGNFHIVWDTEYRTKEIIFNDELIPELIYYVEGSNKSRRIVSQLYVSCIHTSVRIFNIATLYKK